MAGLRQGGARQSSPYPRFCFPWSVAEVSRKRVILWTRHQRVSGTSRACITRSWGQRRGRPC